MEVTYSPNVDPGMAANKQPIYKMRVWNDDENEYVEEFKGDIIRIPAHGNIIMDWYEGVHFLGSFKPFKIDSTGQHQGLKKLRREKVEDEKLKAKEPEKASNETLCVFCMREFQDEKALSNHLTMCQKRPKGAVNVKRD